MNFKWRKVIKPQRGASVQTIPTVVVSFTSVTHPLSHLAFKSSLVNYHSISSAMVGSSTSYDVQNSKKQIGMEFMIKLLEGSPGKPLVCVQMNP